MSFYINAWLDRAKPFISICNRNSKEEVIRFEQQELNALLDDGDLCLDDLCSNDSHEQQMLVKELLLLRCCYAIRSEVGDLEQQPNKRNAADRELPNHAAINMAKNDPFWQTETGQQK